MGTTYGNVENGGVLGMKVEELTCNKREKKVISKVLSIIVFRLNIL